MRIWRKKILLFYSETQTEQKYAIWCRCWYLGYMMKFWCLNQWHLYNSIADTYNYINISHHYISPIIWLSKMRLKWSKHIMQCNPMMIERWRHKRSSEDVRWRSFLRWGTVKVKLLETNVPQKILMIRFETKTWLMENQVKLSCFSPVSVHLEIWLQLFWPLLDQSQSRFSRKTHVKQ